MVAINRFFCIFIYVCVLYVRAPIYTSSLNSGWLLYLLSLFLGLTSIDTRKLSASFRFLLLLLLHGGGVTVCKVVFIWGRGVGMGTCGWDEEEVSIVEEGATASSYEKILHRYCVCVCMRAAGVIIYHRGKRRSARTITASFFHACCPCLSSLVQMWREM